MLQKIFPSFKLTAPICIMSQLSVDRLFVSKSQNTIFGCIVEEEEEEAAAAVGSRLDASARAPIFGCWTSDAN